MSLSTTTAVLALVLAVALAGCGSNETGANLAANEPLEIWFRTLYSAHIPNGSQTFRVPAVVDGVKPSSWAVVPADAAQLEENPATYSVLVTTRRAGKFSVIARSGKRTGAVDLVVTEGTSELLELGRLRYDNGEMLDLTDIFAQGMRPNAACTNCHGAGAALFRSEITPRQIGGYSDEEIIEIITLGEKPLGAPTTTSLPLGFQNMLSSFHRWTAEPQVLRGLVLYLRSLPPVAASAVGLPGEGAAGGSGQP